MSRKRVRLIEYFALCMLVSGCDIPVTFWQGESVNVNVPAVPQTTFSSSLDINLATALAKARQVPGFQGVQIPEVEIEISNVASTNMAAMLTGSLTITDTSDSSFAPITLPYGTIAIADGQESSVTPDPASVQALQTAVMAGDSLKLGFDSNVDATPAQFELTANIQIVALVGT